MHHLTKLAILRSRLTWLLIVVLAFTGIQAYRTLPRSEDPGFIIRNARVITYFPGASPERIETLITDPLEKALQEIPELDFIESESRNGISIVTIQVRDQFTHLRPIWDSLRRKVERTQQILPPEVIGPYVNDEYGDVFGMLLSITGDGYSQAELKAVADRVKDEILLLPDVAKVDLYGVQKECIFVEYNHARLAELGLSPAHVQSMLMSRNIIISGGSIAMQDERIVLEPTGNFESLDELRHTVVQLPGSNEVLYLKDISEITRGYIDPQQVQVYSKSHPALALGVSRQEGGDIIRLGKQLELLLGKMERDLPIGLQFDWVYRESQEVRAKVNEFAGNLLESVLIVGGLMLFALGFRAGMIIGSLIPMTILCTFVLMQAMGIGLDQVSLAALIIALGMLVDNAIVMSEAIMVELEKGTERLGSALLCVQQLAIPLLTSTLTTSAAFLPIYLAQSMAGEYTKALFQVVTISLMSSWALSLTLTPLACVAFLKPGQTPVGGVVMSFLRILYPLLLRQGLRYGRWILLLTGIGFFFSMSGFFAVPRAFFPPADKHYFTAELTMPPGTSLERTKAIVEELSDYIEKDLVAGDGRLEGIVNWTSFLGETTPRFLLSYAPIVGKSELAVLIIQTTSRDCVNEMVASLQKYTDEHFPDLEALISPLQYGPPVRYPLELRISGRNTDQLLEVAKEVKSYLRKQEGVQMLTDDWRPRSKKLQVKVKQPRALRSGVSSRDIAVSLQTNLSGIETTMFRESDQSIPIFLRSVAADREDISKLEGLNVFSQASGTSVPLKQVADISVAWEASSIKRRNRIKTVTVQASLDEGYTARDLAASLEKWIEKKQDTWPEGFRFKIGGEVESSNQANEAVVLKLPFAIFLMGVILVAQFNSFRKPMIIGLTIPLGLIGVVIGLLLTGSYLGFITLLGILSLAGIVVNNAIVLLDRIEYEQEENGLEPFESIISASQSRLRPILLTTLTTIGGLVPLWLSGGPLFEPMAIALIFGLAFSTVLTLGIIPILYSILYDVKIPGEKRIIWQST
ncbi:MAG: acriflavine resistance protein B [Waddliaceae bacterium]|nr:acriflavine resistance protein B [Waddliaceae bacterium]